MTHLLKPRQPHTVVAPITIFLHSLTSLFWSQLMWGLDLSSNCFGSLDPTIRVLLYTYTLWPGLVNFVTWAGH